MYRKRYLEDEIFGVHEHFKILYVGGARQVGKTTMLRRLADQNKIAYVSFDDLRIRAQAKQDPALFLDRYPAPLFIDEVQYVPELFSYLKLRVDRTRRNGQYWLSGSQHFSLMKGMQESLVGRVGIVSLFGFSFAEEYQIQKVSEPFLPKRLSSTSHHSLGVLDVYHRILRGSFPALIEDPGLPLERFYSSYVQTYLDRDVRDIFSVEKMPSFQRFLELAAARTGQILNVSAIARDAGISVHAARSWLAILEASRVIYLLRPYFANISKRLIKAPKLYFLDTGLACFLTGWRDAQTLLSGAMAGAMFETYVVSEIIKSYEHRGKTPSLYYVRTQDGLEMDLLIDADRELSPIEVKVSATPRQEDLRPFDAIRELFPRVGHGAIISLAQERYALNREVDMIPVTHIV